MSYIYLASPYSHPLKARRQDNWEDVAAQVLHYHQRGITAYSPILHYHNFATRFALETDFAAFASHNENMLRSASELYVLTLAGWRQSKGVAYEMQLAQELALPISFVTLQLSPQP